MDIRCERCAAPIAAEDVNLENVLAKCRQCHAVFSIRRQLSAVDEGRAMESAQPRELAPVALPPGLAIERGEQGGFVVGYRDGAGSGRSAVRIVRRWFNARSDLGLLLFAIAWNAFLVNWYSMAFSGREVPWIMVVFPVGHVAVGVGIAYRALAGLLNRTTISVTPSQLSVRHAPLPWLGNRDLNAGEVTQLFCVDKLSRGKNTSRSFEVHANLANGASLVLVSGLTALHQALFIEQEVERALAIADVAVPGAIEH